MNFNHLLFQHDKLYNDVQESFEFLINTSKTKSKYLNTNCINVNIFDYVEMVIVNDQLTFIDSRGLYYDLTTDCTLLDLIEILIKKQ